MNEKIILQCAADFQRANFRCEPEFLRRFAASLLAKRFVILTGLSGSGKTKLAQAFARWISSPAGTAADVFRAGAEIPSDRITYYVHRSDALSVEFWNDRDEAKATKVLLPRGLIEEWAACLESNKLNSDALARQVRKLVALSTRYSGQLNSFETHLKAAAFALLAAPKNRSATRCYEIVSVGADWTSNENVVGYPDGLDRSRYQRTTTLDLILRAQAEPGRPFFLILDEMNLSHVERYFADFLSAIESDAAIPLHSDRDAAGNSVPRDGVPGEVHLPANLFVIGTVNVDETTYLFSPKVLDRANVLEFRVSEEELQAYLENPVAVDLAKLDGVGEAHGPGFVAASRQALNLPAEVRQKLAIELGLFFSSLQSVHGEFGFRVAKETAAFVHFHHLLGGGTWEFAAAMDAQIIQKLLPRLHGARSLLEPILISLATLCFAPRDWQRAGEITQLRNREELFDQARRAARLEEDGLDPLARTDDGALRYPPAGAAYPLSFGKLARMLERLRANGFVSFAEA